MHNDHLYEHNGFLLDFDIGAGRLIPVGYAETLHLLQGHKYLRHLSCSQQEYNLEQTFAKFVGHYLRIRIGDLTAN